MEAKTITEKEVIEILIEEGLSNGEERETSFYRKNGYVNSDGSLDAVLEKLEQVFTFAKLVINPKSKKGKPYGGRKRLYEIGEKRSTLIERTDGRQENKRKIKKEYQILDEYFLYRLTGEAKRIGDNNVMKTMGAWTDFIFGNWILADPFVSAYRTRMDELLNERIDERLLTEVKSQILKQLNEMMYSNLKTIINRLEENGSIEKSTEQFAKYTNEHFDMINQELKNCYREELKNPYTPIMANELIPIKQDIAKIFKSYGLQPSRYETLAAFPQYCTSDDEKKALNEAKAFLYEKGYQFYFNNHRLFPVDEVEEIDLEVAKTAYFTWIIERTESRMKKYRESIYLKEVIFDLGIYILLDEAGCERYGINLKDKITFIIESLDGLIDDVQYRYAVEKATAEQKQEEPVGGWGFGELAKPKETVSIPKEINMNEVTQSLEGRQAEKQEDKPEVMKANEREIELEQENEGVKKPMSDDLNWLTQHSRYKKPAKREKTERKANQNIVADGPNDGPIDIASIGIEDEQKQEEPKRTVHGFFGCTFIASPPVFESIEIDDEPIDIPDEVMAEWIKTAETERLALVS